MVITIAVERQERARTVLAQEPMTMPRLLVRGTSWREVMNLVHEGEVEFDAGPNGRPIFRLAG